MIPNHNHHPVSEAAGSAADGHVAEPDLILYQLRESPTAGEIQAHLEGCARCAALADSIAHTLRIFSAAPVPAPDVTLAWHRMRPQLVPITSETPARERKARFRLDPWRMSVVVGGALAATLLLTVGLNHRRAVPMFVPPVARSGSGPISDHPADPALAAHLDSAERFLTEVSHGAEPFDPATREQAQALLVHNAFYTETARQAGDLADAAVLEKLGRVLTTLNHAPATDATPDARGWHLRFQINTDGLLLDLRILRQNDAHQQHAAPSSLQEMPQ